MKSSKVWSFTKIQRRYADTDRTSKTHFLKIFDKDAGLAKRIYNSFRKKGISMFW